MKGPNKGKCETKRKGNGHFQDDYYFLVNDHMGEDRTELDNLVASNAGKAEELRTEYEAWAERCGVLPWPADSQEQGSSRKLIQRWGT